MTPRREALSRYTLQVHSATLQGLADNDTEDEGDEGDEDEGDEESDTAPPAAQPPPPSAAAKAAAAKIDKSLQEPVDRQKLVGSKLPGPPRRRQTPERGASSQPASKLNVRPLTLVPTSASQPEVCHECFSRAVHGSQLLSVNVQARVTRASTEKAPAGRVKRIAQRR